MYFLLFGAIREIFFIPCFIFLRCDISVFAIGTHNQSFILPAVKIRFFNLFDFETSVISLVILVINL